MATKYNVKISRPNTNVDWPDVFRVTEATATWFSNQPNMTYDETVSDLEIIKTFTFPTREDYNTFRSNYLAARADGTISGDLPEWTTEVQNRNITKTSWVVDV